MVWTAMQSPNKQVKCSPLINKLNCCLLTAYKQSKSVFVSVVPGAFQIIFRAKMHVNNIFFIF
jgi:hypothetical protein